MGGVLRFSSFPPSETLTWLSSHLKTILCFVGVPSSSRLVLAAIADFAHFTPTLHQHFIIGFKLVNQELRVEPRGEIAEVQALVLHALSVATMLQENVGMGRLLRQYLENVNQFRS